MTICPLNSALARRRQQARTTQSKFAHVVVVAAALTASGVSQGCRSHSGIRQQYAQMRTNLVQGNYPAAVAQLEAAKDNAYKEEDRVMYWLNLGTLLHYAGDYRRSQGVFVKAEKTIQDLWTKSISEEASKFVVSESIQDYPAEDFEKVLVYFYTAMNQVRQNRLQDALVEARRADQFLQKIQIQYEKEKEKVGTLYKQDAFMLWLIGVFYEIEGSWSDATSAYDQAYRTYRTQYGKFGAAPPAFLAEDVMRVAAMAGRTDKVSEYRRFAKGQTVDRLRDGMGEVIFIHGSGEAPQKRQKFITARMSDGYVARIAIPQFEPRPWRIMQAEMTVANQTVRTELAEPIARIALDNYKHRLPAITARAIARATVKYVATKGTQKILEGDQKKKKEMTKKEREAQENRKTLGALAGLIGNVASFASEAADLRAWTTLPAMFGVGRVWLPAGEHQVKIRYLGKNGAPIGPAQTQTIKVVSGERKFVSVRTFL